MTLAVTLAATLAATLAVTLAATLAVHHIPRHKRYQHCLDCFVSKIYHQPAGADQNPMVALSVDFAP